MKKSELAKLDEYIVGYTQYETEGDGFSCDKPEEGEELLSRIRAGTHLWMKPLTEEEKKLCYEPDDELKYGLTDRKGRIWMFLYDSACPNGIYKIAKEGDVK